VSTIRQIWDTNLSLTTESRSLQKRIPIIHYSRLLQLIRSLVLEDSSSSGFGFIVPAFDLDPSPLVHLLQEINKRVNVGIELPTDGWIGPWEESHRQHQNPPWNIDLTKLFSKVKKFPASLDSTVSMLSNFQNDWNEFLTENGLTQVTILVAGPPRSGKTTASKNLAEK
jgi:hypothetical protein